MLRKDLYSYFFQKSDLDEIKYISFLVKNEKYQKNTMKFGKNAEIALKRI